MSMGETDAFIDKIVQERTNFYLLMAFFFSVQEPFLRRLQAAVLSGQRLGPNGGGAEGPPRSDGVGGHQRARGYKRNFVSPLLFIYKNIFFPLRACPSRPG